MASEREGERREEEREERGGERKSVYSIYKIIKTHRFTSSTDVNR